MSDFVTALNTRTGEPQRIPTEWLGHPVLGTDFAPMTEGEGHAPDTTTTKPAGKRATTTKKEA